MFTLLVASLAAPNPVLVPQPKLLARVGSPAFRRGSDMYPFAVSPDGRHVYLGSLREDNRGSSLTAVEVWDAQTGTRIRRYDPNAIAGFV